MALSDDRTDSYVKQLRTLLNPTVQLALLVVPQQKSDRYAAIKKFCCLEMPVPSQVVCVKTINNEKRLNAVAQKIALQINVRLVCTKMNFASSSFLFLYSANLVANFGPVKLLSSI